MQDRAYGCLIGAAIGDAMGMPASFMTPDQIERVYGKITGFLKPKEEQIAHGNLEEGEITDDTEETLIISSVLIEGDGFKESIFIEKMKKWAVDNKMLESTVIGPSTRNFLEAIIEGRDYYEKGKLGDTNGGAMRVAPIGIYNHGNVEKSIKEAIASAKPSHGSKPGVASTSAIAAAIALSIEGGVTAAEVIEAAYKGAIEGEKVGYDIPAPLVSSRIRLAKEIVDNNQDKSLDEICRILYEHIGAGMKSYESIPLSLGVFYAAKGDFEKGIISTINIGDDADTNGSIVGALCGAFSGANKINPKWIEKVKESNKIDFEEIAKSLLQ
ncbi:ADP-ribosylglycohydrolase family protein [Wukongibacter baidiensis]|uniref:ADP-ribosylglycohydrolase family protein n=1 Tax=Wukongibacter baidiensis TaxID=1723361 RepID=UPI003D7FA735